MAAAWGSGLTATEQSAIDIAVQVSGQQAVTDLQTRLTNVQGAIGVLNQQYAAGTIAQRDYLQQIQQLIINEAKLEESVKRAENALRGFNKELQFSQQAGLQLGYALDDLQYGFSAIVNNIPGIVQSLGGSAGLAGALGVVAVGANILLKVMPDLSHAFTTLGRDFDLVRDPIKDASDSLAGMKEVIKELNEKPLKFAEDYASLRNLTAEANAAERALRDLEALKNKRSSSQQEAVESVQKGIQEGGGAENFVNAYIQIAKQNGTYGAGSDLVGKIREQQEIARGQAGQVNDLGPLGALARYRFDGAKAEIARLNEELRKEQELKAANLLNLTNGEGSRKTLDDLLGDPRNQGILRANQIDVDRFGAGVAGASPERIQGAQRAKVAEAERKRAKKEADNIREQEDFLAENQRQIDEGLERQKNKDAEEEAATLKKRNDDAGRLREKADREKAVADRKAQNDALRAEREAPGLQQKRDVRDLGREARGRAMGMGLGEMNAAQAQAAGQKALGLIKQGLDPNAALQKTIFDMAQAVEQAHANIQAQQMGFLNVSQRMRALNQNARRGRQRGPTIGMTH